MTTTNTTTMTTTTMCKDNRTVLDVPALSPIAMEGGRDKKEEGGNNAIIGVRGGGYYAVRVGLIFVPPPERMLL
jgi:hypothetical protein